LSNPFNALVKLPEFGTKIWIIILYLYMSSNKLIFKYCHSNKVAVNRKTMGTHFSCNFWVYLLWHTLHIQALRPILTSLATENILKYKNFSQFSYKIQDN
jgi:hypothetical protein